MSFCLEEEAAEDRKGGECPEPHSAITLTALVLLLSKLNAGRDPRRKSRLSRGSDSSECSTCLPDDYIVELQTELSKSGPHAVLLAVLCARAGIRSCASEARCQAGKVGDGTGRAAVCE